MKRLLFVFIFVLMSANVAYANDAQIMDVHIVASSWGMSFTFRNTTGVTLYYGYGYRLFMYTENGWEVYEMPNGALAHSQAIDLYINPGQVNRCAIRWGRSDLLSFSDIRIDHGLYRFERDFFIGTDGSGNPIGVPVTVSAEFEITEQPTDPRPNSTAREENIAFIMAGKPSNIITLASGVAVGRREMAFIFYNNSQMEFTEYSLNMGFGWELLRYVDGWQIVSPYSYTNNFGPFRPRWFEPIYFGYGSRQWNFNFLSIYGFLPNGRYMVIINFHRSTPHGSTFNHEYLFIEFEIDDNTPFRVFMVDHNHQFRLTDQAYAALNPPT